MQPVENMEEIINTLLAQDAQAQEKLRAHQQLRQQMADQMAKVKEDTQKKNYDRANSRVEDMRKESRNELDEQLLELKVSYENSLKGLSETYLSHRDEWVDRIFHRCVD